MFFLAFKDVPPRGCFLSMLQDMPALPSTTGGAAAAAPEELTQPAVPRTPGESVPRAPAAGPCLHWRHRAEQRRGFALGSLSEVVQHQPQMHWRILLQPAAPFECLRLVFASLQARSARPQGAASQCRSSVTAYAPSRCTPSAANRQAAARCLPMAHAPAIERTRLTPCLLAPALADEVLHVLLQVYATEHVSHPRRRHSLQDLHLSQGAMQLACLLEPL